MRNSSKNQPIPFTRPNETIQMQYLADLKFIKLPLIRMEFKINRLIKQLLPMCNCLLKKILS